MDDTNFSKEDKKWLIKRIDKSVSKRSKLADPISIFFIIASLCAMAFGMKLIWGWGVSLLVGGFIAFLFAVISGGSSVDTEDDDDRY